jgi:hypothetical protein
VSLVIYTSEHQTTKFFVRSMLSTRQASKQLEALVLPEVRGEVIRTQKLINTLLCESRASAETALFTEAEASLLREISKLFPESLSLASGLIHTALNETSRRGLVYGMHATVRAAIALSARFIMSKEQGESDELSLVDPLLRHAIGCLKTHPHAELYALCCMNRAIAIEMSDSPKVTSRIGTLHRSEPLWKDASYQMPKHLWVKYPSLLNGTARLLAHLRDKTEGPHGFTSLLEAAEIARIAYERITTPPMKGSSLERERPVVALLAEIAATHRLALSQGLQSSQLPGPLAIEEHAYIHSRFSSENPLLFVSMSITLAKGYITAVAQPDNIDKARAIIIGAAHATNYMDEKAAEPLRLELATLLAALDEFERESPSNEEDGNDNMSPY